MLLRQVGSNAAAASRRLPALGRRLRPGVVLALSVAAVAGLAGLVQWNQRLMTIGLVAGAAILAVNAVVVAAHRWHTRNTSPEAIYANAEDVVRFRNPKSR